ncbi:hypothetical protein [Salinarchaeum laminariae]|uniref:hypothetical protein n=1 Tax=Salinarchaeum laminariae TaxID=869888 RepID=UPI0020BE8073|nr:hypothetical protein [Salinarchaeum laminariae]
MGAIPGGVDTSQQPPMTVPLRHFVVGLAFLLAGTLLGLGHVANAVPGLSGLAHVHLLLVGWVCLTIMGAMTQFVPVWSGVELHSRRLASVQLVLVVTGLLAFVAGLLALELHLLAIAGATMLVGFWTFVYNVGRTLARAGKLDVTERHFALSLGFFLLLTLLGLALAVDFTRPFLAEFGVSRTGVVGAHATLAVFGAVLTTIYGALYQLGTMFTQTELHGVDHRLRAIEEIGHPVGVVLLAGGRLFEVVPVAQVGGILIVVAALAFAVVLARKLVEMQVPRTPMHTRYAVVAVALASWALLTAPAWLVDPTALDHRFGGPGTAHLLLLGVVGFVVVGTLYHIVPFVVWVHRYSDELGFEPVPMIDDLYDDRIAAVDGILLVAGTATLVGWELLEGPRSVVLIAGGLVSLGILAFLGNVALVLHRHSPQPLDRIVFGSLGRRRSSDVADESPSES